MASVLRLFPTYQVPLPPQPISSSPAIESTSLLTTLFYAIIHYARLYGARALLLTILSLITVFRREMSSNRVYLTEEEKEKEERRERRRRRRRRKTSLSHAPNDGTATSESLSTEDNETMKEPIANNESSHDDEEEDDDDHYYEEADELFDHVGMEYTGFKQIFTVVLSVWAHMLLTKIHEEKGEKKDGDDASQTMAKENNDCTKGDISSPATKSTQNTTRRKSQNELYLTTLIPPDAQVHIFTFLHPRDILTFSCVSKSSHALIHTEGHEENNISALLWKSLWRRDYAWIVLEWNVGRRALQRSLSLLASCSKEDFNGENDRRRLQRQGSSFSSALLEKSSFLLYPPSLRSGESNGKNEEEEEFEKSSGGTTTGVLRRLASVFDEKCPFSENDDNECSSVDSGDVVKLPPLPSFILSDSNTYDPPGNSHMENDSKNQERKEQNSSMMTMKEFYLTFSQCWINYTLAGQNTYDNCLVGLHGHVFDITDFLEQHPGSSETLLVNGGGRDATKYFEDLGHSVSARKMANDKFCVVMDCACLQTNDELMGDDSYHGAERAKQSNLTSSSPSSSWGLKRPTKSMLLFTNDDDPTKNMQLIPSTRSKPKRPGTLYSIKEKLCEEETFELTRAEEWFDSSDNDDCNHKMGNLHVFYDPFLGRWRSWYMNDEFKVVFL